MTQSKFFFNYNPGDDSGSGDTAAGNKEKNINSSEMLDNETSDDGDKKTFKEKVHDALQEWSNDDKRDQEFDDTRP